MDNMSKSSKYCLAIVVGIILGAIIMNMLSDKSNNKEDCGCDN